MRKMKWKDRKNRQVYLTFRLLSAILSGDDLRADLDLSGAADMEECGSGGSRYLMDVDERSGCR